MLIASLVLLPLFSSVAQETQKFNQYGVAVTSDRLDVEAQDGILVLSSPNTRYKLWFDIRVQADGAAFFGAPSWADKIGTGVQIRRARFAVKGQIDENWYGEFDMDLANGLVELKDAIVRYTGVPNLDIQVGNFKENFSIQRNTTSRYLMFMERPMVCSALTPSRHLGFNVKYAKDWIWASAGIFGPEFAGAEEWTNIADNNKDYGRPCGYSLTAKTVFRPLYQLDNASLHIGLAYSYRTPLASEATGDWGSFRASCRNSTSINRKKYIDTNLVPNYDHSHLFTAELAGHWEGLRYEAAYIGNVAQFKDGASKYFSGWYVQAGYLLFGGKQRYDSKGAKYTKVERGRKWGDIELCGRVETVDLNADKALAPNLQKVMGGSAMAYTLGINYYVNNNVKFQLNYQFNDNDRFANGKNKLFSGLDENGAPTKDPYKTVGKAGVDYHMVSLRFEIDF